MMKNQNYIDDDENYGVAGRGGEVAKQMMESYLIIYIHNYYY